jgi:hypothetical protein
MNHAWLREPLLRFLLLGALIFLVDRLATRSSTEASVIQFDPRTREEQLAIFGGKTCGPVADALGGAQ